MCLPVIPTSTKIPMYRPLWDSWCIWSTSSLKVFDVLVVPKNLGNTWRHGQVDGEKGRPELENGGL